MTSKNLNKSAKNLKRNPTTTTPRLLSALQPENLILWTSLLTSVKIKSQSKTVSLRIKLKSLDAETLKELQKQIDELKLSSGGSGGSVDLNELDKRYAGKNKPDSTIVRIEALE